MNATAKTKMFAFVAVFAMMLCAIVPMIGATEQDAAYGYYGDYISDTGNGTYSVDIATGWTFSYPNIATNLDNISGGNVSLTYAETKNSTANSPSALTLSSRTLSGSFSEAGTYVGTLTATWTKTAGGNAMTQTATQQITFNVSAQVLIDDKKAANASAFVIADKPAATGNSEDNGTATPTAANTQIASIGFTAPGTTTDTVKYTAKGGSTFSTTNPGFFTVTTNNTSTSGNITVALSRIVTNAEVGTYQIEVTKSYGTTGDSAKVTFTVNVFDGLAIITDYDHYYTYETDTHFASGIAVSSNYTTGGESLVLDSFNVTPSGSTNPMSKNTSAQKIDVSTTKGTYLSSSEVSKDYTATITMAGHLAANTSTTTSSSKTITLTIYADLAFTSVPTSNGASITTNSNSGTSITLSSYIKGAKTVVFDWGDGIKTSTMEAGAVVGQNYSAAHTYAKTGTYLISIIAENDAGATRSQVLYNAYADEETPATTPSTTDPETPAQETKDKELKDFTLQIAMVVIGALALFIVFRFGYNYAIVVYIAAGVAILGLILAGLQFFDVYDLSNVSNDIVDFFSNLFGQKSSNETPAETE